MRHSAPVLALVLALAPLGCARDEFAEKLEDTTSEAMQSLEHTPELIRTEVLRTCDKWKHIEKACVDDEARLDQMECWLEHGLRHYERAVEKRLRQRARDRKTMLHHNLCMEKRGWRFKEPSRYI